MIPTYNADLAAALTDTVRAQASLMSETHRDLGLPPEAPAKPRTCELCGLPESGDEDDDSHLSLAGNDSVSSDDRILVCNRRTCRADY